MDRGALVRYRTPNLSFRARVLLIGLIPFLGMLAFAAFWTHGRVEARREAERDTTRIEALTALGRVAFTARSSSALAPASSGSGVPASIAPALEARYEAARAHLDEMGDALRRDRATIEPYVGTEQWERIVDSLDAYVRQEDRMVVASSAPLARRAALFEGLSRRIDTLEHQITLGQQNILHAGGDIEGGEALVNATKLPALTFVQAQVVIPALLGAVPPSPNDAILLGESVGAEDALTVELSTELEPPLRDDLAAATSSAAARSWRETTLDVVRAGAAGRPSTLVDPTAIFGLNSDIQTKVGDLSDVRSAIAATLTADNAATISSTRRALWLAIGITLTVTLLTLAMVYLLLRSVTGSISTLVRQARRVGEGDLDIESLPPEGPADMRVLTDAFNDMTETLRGVAERAEHLAAEGQDDPAASEHPLPGAIGAALDRTVERLGVATERLRAREMLARTLIETASEGVWTIDADGVIRSVNSAAVRISGLSEEEMVGRDCRSVAPIATVCARTHDEGTRTPATLQAVELELPHPDGHVIPALVTTTDIIDEDGRDLWAVFAFDISERREQERLLAYEASHDALTGLPNRASAHAALEDGLAASRESGGGCGLLFVDLDNFKHVNDAMGHPIGDELLTRVGDRLRDLVRPGDIVARLGGDEFVVVVRPAGSVEMVAEIAERVIDGLGGPFDLSSERAWVSASVGVAWTASGDTTADDLLRDADIAMYRAKQKGRGTVAVFDDTMRRWTEERASTEQRLRAALAGKGLNDRYQPIIDLSSGEVVGAELLARLPYPEGEMLPSHFIEVAEESGLIVDVGRWALRTACERLIAWESAGHDALRIWVNASALHLASGELLRDVKQASEVLDGGLHRLGIEVTESFLLQDERTARATLRSLREMGLAVALDDFGTGYSSLAYLHNLPIDTVKVDRSFVVDMEHDALGEAIVRSVAWLSRARGLKVVAEGIETTGQARHVRAAGCQLAQGYLYSPPVTFEELEQWVLERRRSLGGTPGVSRPPRPERRPG